MRTFLLGAAVGYVLGAKAGRARYDQIVRTYRKVADHPMVQGAAGVARAKVGEKVGDKVPFFRNGHRVSEPRVTQP
ncbi:hypothetical protein [Amycolatopsis sp. GM8]|uniref:hypothetical protein n=1 Tax=Amycolatopsis sp. GM8 TaxID=2896530 RepID=UPI001F36BEB9|nr:hypothetical protein [Amycolatopsis sp. GM8]